jgi:dolichol-phosphate mannosyltransferase
MNKKLVIIPTYNEKENIELIIDAVLSLPANFDILIVDDNSPDGTGEIIQQVVQNSEDRVHLETRKGKMGLGTAYIHGFKWALRQGYDFIFEMDADFSHNPDDLPILLSAMVDQKAGMVIGSRYVRGVNVVNWPMGRVLMSYFASRYVRFITGMDIHDTTAGFVGYRADTLKQIDLDKVKFVGYAFQIEMKYRVYLKHLKIIEIPIIFTDRTRGESKLNGNIINEAVFGVLKMRLGSLIGKYR